MSHNFSDTTTEDRHAHAQETNKMPDQSPESSNEERGEKKLIISTMKDEAPYLLEWIAYHRAVGFTDFLIYTNDCSDGTDLLLDRLQHNGIVTHIRNQVLRRGPHKSALKYAKTHDLYAAASWVFVCDVDEFLNVKTGNGRLDDLLSYYKGADAIPVTWRMFSNAGEIELFPGPSMEVFTDAEPEAALPDAEGRFVKSVFKPGENVARIGLHAPVYEEDAAHEISWGASWLQVDPDADPRRPKENFGYDIAQVNHYAVRTVDAFLIKRNRGRANHVGETLGIGYWKRWCRGGETDTSIHKHLDAMRIEYEALLKDPIVKYLEQGGRAYQKAQLQDLLQREDFLALKNELVSTSEPAPKKQPALQLPSSAAVELATPQEADQIISAILAENDRSRAPNRRELRRKMLDEVMPKGARCAEIGVWQGDFSAEILNITKPRELVLIDPWDLLAVKTEEHTHAQHADALKMRAKYDQIMSTIGRLPNCIVRKGFSAQVLETYPDGYFDWVYIDGNHTYEFVLEDIMVSARKVRSGGLIAGDDLFWKRDGRMHVREAMREAMRQLGDRATQTRRGAQFLIHIK